MRTFYVMEKAAWSAAEGMYSMVEIRTEELTLKQVVGRVKKLRGKTTEFLWNIKKLCVKDSGGYEVIGGISVEEFEDDVPEYEYVGEGV